jgi:hypothetical protein
MEITHRHRMTALLSIKVTHKRAPAKIKLCSIQPFPGMPSTCQRYELADSPQGSKRV